MYELIKIAKEDIIICMKDISRMTWKVENFSLENKTHTERKKGKGIWLFCRF
jgi:hypothetical protein